VGGRLATSLAARGHTVLSYGRRPAPALCGALPNYVAWDVSAGPIEDPRVDAVVHCAARVGDWGSEASFRAVNVDGARAVLESFPSARRFVHISSTSVYSDDVVKIAVREDASVGRCRHSAYGRTKAEAERVVASVRPDAVILRPHIVYGPGDTTLLPRVLAARRFGRLPIPGHGRNGLSVTHVDNLGLAVARALETPAVRGIFNISDAEAVSADELLRTILARQGVPPNILYVPRAVAWCFAVACELVWPVGDAPRGPPLTRYLVENLADDHTVDITRARVVLGYEPRWSYRDGPLTLGGS
jgi:nucleoside-diphosphate-sugar epimerase